MIATAEELVARLRRNPDDPAAYAALKAHYHQQNDFASLAKLVEGWARRAADADLAARAFHEAALLVEHYQGEHARAVELFELALERDPSLRDAHRDLDHLIEAVGDPRLRIESLERRIAVLDKTSGDPARIASLRFQLGEAWERGFKRSDRALEQYLAALALAPNMMTALYAARVSYQSAGKVREAADLLEREARIEPDRDRALALYLELGQVRAQQLDDLDGAVRAAEAALALSPGGFDAMHELAYLLRCRAARDADSGAGLADAERAAALYFLLAQSSRDGDALALCEATLDLVPTHEPALDLLEALARDLDQMGVLPLRWVGYLREAKDSPAARRRRHELAAAYIEAEQLDDAIYCLEPLLSRGDARAAEALSELYLREGRTEEANAALAVAVRSLPSAERAARLHAAIEALDSEGRHEEAKRAAEELLAADPADDFVREFLEKAYRAAGETSQRVALRMKAARAENVAFERRVELYREAAELAGAADDVEGACDAWRGLLELEPGAKDALEQLRAHLSRGGRFDELAGILERSALTLTDPAEKSALLLELATLHQESRRDLVEARRVLRAARELSPGDPAVRDRLCDLLVETGPREEAVPLLRERLAESPPREQRIGLEHALADALEAALGDREGAYAISQRILEAAPDDARALERMERVDVALGQSTRLLETLERRAAIAATEERPALLVRMAELAASALDEVDRAVSLYREALALIPLDAAAREGLRALLEKAERHEELASFLEELVASEADPERRRDYLRQRARVLAGPLGDADGAAKDYAELLEEVDDAEAVEMLLTHARERGELTRWAELAPRRVAHLGDSETAQELRLALAEVLVRDLGELREGARALREALAHRPGDLVALARLEDVYERLGEHARLAEALETHLASIEEDAKKTPLEAKLSVLYAGPLDRPEDAIRLARAWVRHAPGHREPLEHLSGLLEEHGEPSALLEVLDALVALDPPRGREHVVRAARVCADAMGDPQTGFDRLAARLEEGDEGILRPLREYALEHGRAGALAELIDRYALSLGEDPRAFALHDAAAEVWLDHVGDPAAAMSSALRAHACRPSLESLERLDGLAVLADDFDRLIEAYRAVLGCVSEDDRIGIIERLAGVLDDRAGDPARALEVLASACARRPQREELFERAEELARSAGRDELLLEIHERRAASTDSAEQRLRALLRSAELAARELGTLERSLAHLDRAVELASSSPEDLARIESLAARLDEELGASAGDPCRSRLASAYATLAERPGGGEVRTMLVVRAARLLGPSLGRPKRAFELLLEAAAGDPSNERVLRELEAVARDGGLLLELASSLESLVEQSLEAATAARLSRRRGDLLRDELGRPSEAAEAYRRMMTLTPHDPLARKSLRHALQAAGRFEDLVMMLERELRSGEGLSRDERLALRRVVAMSWEGPLHNRWEAIDAWKAVLEESPEDAEALEALRRVEAGELLDAPPPELERPEGDLGADLEDEPEIPIGTAPSGDDEIIALESLADVLVDDVGAARPGAREAEPEERAGAASTAAPPPPPSPPSDRPSPPDAQGAEGGPADGEAGLDTLIEPREEAPDDEAGGDDATLAETSPASDAKPLTEREPEPT